MRAATFTTYINAQTDPGLEAAFDRQTRVATASYGTIAAAAKEATRATAGLLAGKGTAGIQSASRALDVQTRSTRSATAAAADNERQAARTSLATRRQRDVAISTAQAHTGLANSLNTTATAFSVVQGRMGPLAGRLTTVARAAEQLTGLQLGLAGVGATLFALGSAGNQYAVLASRLRPFYDTQTQANQAMSDVIGIAKRSRTALEPVVEIYARLQSNAEALGLSQQRVGRLTEFASKAATLSGGTAAARSGALVQFSQAVGSNFQAGAGQEFNSLQEGASQVAVLLARYFKNADGSIGTTIENLKKLSAEGKLTTEQIADAADRATPALEKMFAAMPKTLGTAGSEFSNSLTVMVGRFDQSVGLTNTLAESISLVAENLRVITGLAVGAGAAFAGIKLIGLTKDATSAVRSTLVMNSAIKQLGVARQANATASVAQHQREIAALNAEQAEIRENIALLERQRAVASRDRARSAPDTASGFAGSSRRVAQAAGEERTAVRALIQERQRLGIITGALSTAQLRAAASQARLDIATGNVTKRVGLLRSAAGGLVSFLGGPWGIAFGIAATAVYLLATAESAAERATRLHEDAQRSFAGIIDSTTGKIYDQVDALQKLAISKKIQIDDVAQGDQQRRAVESIVATVRGVTRDSARSQSYDPSIAQIPGRVVADPALRRLDALTSAVERGERGSLARLTAAIAETSRTNASVAGIISKVDKDREAAISARTSREQGRAAQRILAGNERPGDAAVALGERPLTTNGKVRPRTKAQIDAAVQERAAQTDLQRARADLAKIRADGRGATETEDAYIERLAAATTAVRSAQQAESSLGKSRTAGAAAARKEARDAIQDAKDRAAATRDAALLDLEKSKPTLSQDGYLQARIKILSTYDEEVNKLDASAAASSSAASVMIADAKRIAAASATAAEKRRDILSSYEDAPKAVIRANDQIDDLQSFVDTAVDGVAFLGKTKEQIAEISKLNPLGTGIYTQEMADADRQRIEQGVRKPIEEANREAERGVRIANLQLQGRDAEAEALRRTYQLYDQIGQVTADDFDRILGQVQQEEKINDLLSSRQRITGLLQGTVDATRDSFEQFLTDLPNNAPKAAGNFLKSFQQRFNQINARILTEKLFAGTDEKVRALLTGKVSVDGALRQYIDTLGSAETGTARLATATEQAAARINAATSGLAAGSGGVGSSDIGSNPANIGAVVANTLAGGSSAAAGIVAIASAAATKATGGASNDNAPQVAGQDIIVTGQRVLRQATQVIQGSKATSPKELYNVLGRQVGSNIDDALHGIFGSGKKNPDGTFDTSSGGLLGLGNTTFFKKMGDTLGGALKGAGTGSMVAGVSNMLGIKMSNTGAQVGGAIGSALPIPGGDIIGSIAGGLIGNLFKKTKYGTASVSMNEYGELTSGLISGRGSGQKAAATGAAASVAEGLTSIAKSLGATISGAPGLTIGTYKDAYRVSTSGRTGKLKGKYSDVVDFGKDGEQEAIEFAIRYSIENAVLTGISQASINILKSGQDLEQAVEKAGIIESIPKRLMQIQDPVRYAITQLNTEFATMISYLKEGGATAEQFADAQKLYELERASAIEQAMEQAATAIDDFLKEMTGGSSSPYSKRTTYSNAASELQKFESEIAGGKAVDQTDLLNAARNFQDASRSLNGSSSAFFSDFEMLRSLLEKARDNAGLSTDVSTLPASPFSTDTTVQSAIAALQGATATATQAQTDTLANKLDQVIAAIESTGLLAVGFGGDMNKGAISSLPGFSNVA